MEKVAIVLVNYNGIKDTIDCISSINKSKTKAKIYIVDNASENQEGDTLSDMFHEAIVINQKENIGFAGGNNIGIKRALQDGFEYIILLNNDTVIDPLMITELLKHVRDDCVVLPKMFYYSQKEELWYGGGKINSFTGNVEHTYEFGDCQCDFATGCCMIIHKNVFDAIGFLNEDYFMYYEDADFSLRLKEHGIIIRCVSSAKLWHKVGKSSGGELSPLSVYYNTRNRILMIKRFKHYFKCTALIFTILSRVIRMIQYRYKRYSSWKLFNTGICDGLKSVSGKVELD